MEIQTYIFEPIDARMYVLIEDKDALIIDPNIQEELKLTLQENDVDKITVILTHEHYDHISGVNWLRDNFKNVQVICLKQCIKGLEDSKINLSAFYEVLFISKDQKVREYVEKMNVQPYSCTADNIFENERRMVWKSHSLCLKETPGHSKGSICILLDDEVLFSGDTLVTGEDTILRLPGGSKKDFETITMPYLESLDKDIVVYPGHGEPQQLFQYFQ
ncbi:MAG: MBL fold metallo-hydrolase [Eubacterium sp.]